MVPQQVRTALASRRPLGGRGRFVIVSMVLAVTAALLNLPTLPAEGRESPTLFVLFAAGIAGTAAYLLMFAFGLFRWVLDGYDDHGRRYFIQFLGAFVLFGTIAVFVELFRQEVSAPYPTTEGCWYTLRDRWTSEVELKKLPCPGDWKIKTERGRFEQIVS